MKLPKLIPYRKGDKWGYCDSTKRMIIPAKYDMVYPFSGDTAVVIYGEQRLLIDTIGNETFFPDSVSIESHHYLRIVNVGKSEVCGLIDAKGNYVIKPTDFGLSWIGENYLFASRGLRIAVYDWLGRQILGFNYLWYDFDPRGINTDSGKFILENRRKEFGVIDTSGKIIVPFIYGFIRDAGCGYYVAEKGKMSYAMDSNGNVIYTTKGGITPHRIFFRMAGFDEGTISPQVDSCVRCLLSRKIIYPLPMDTLIDGIYMFGFRDEKGKIVIPPKYDFVDTFDKTGLAQIYKSKNPHIKSNDIFLGYMDIHGTEYWEDEGNDK